MVKAAGFEMAGLDARVANSGEKSKTGTDCHWHWNKHWKYWFKTLDFTEMGTEKILTSKNNFFITVGTRVSCGNGTEPNR